MHAPSSRTGGGCLPLEKWLWLFWTPLGEEKVGVVVGTLSNLLRYGYGLKDQIPNGFYVQIDDGRVKSILDTIVYVSLKKKKIEDN